VNAIRHFDGSRYELHAYVVMNNHVHVIVHPWPERELEWIISSWKSYSARQIQRSRGLRGPVWQREYFDRIVRDQEEFREKLRYIQSNPFKRWPGLESYLWVWPLLE